MRSQRRLLCRSFDQPAFSLAEIFSTIERYDQSTFSTSTKSQGRGVFNLVHLIRQEKAFAINQALRRCSRRQLQPPLYFFTVTTRDVFGASFTIKHAARFAIIRQLYVRSAQDGAGTFIGGSGYSSHELIRLERAQQTAS